MDHVGVRALRADVASVVRRAQAGERVVVTVDGRPVAQLGPIEPTDGTLTLADLVARGQLVPARRDDRPEEGFSMPMWAGVRLDQLVREVRGR